MQCTSRCVCCSCLTPMRECSHCFSLSRILPAWNVERVGAWGEDFLRGECRPVCVARERLPPCIKPFHSPCLCRVSEWRVSSSTGWGALSTHAQVPLPRETLPPRPPRVPGAWPGRGRDGSPQPPLLPQDVKLTVEGDGNGQIRDASPRKKGEKGPGEKDFRSKESERRKRGEGEGLRRGNCRGGGHTKVSCHSLSPKPPPPLPPPRVFKVKHCKKGAVTPLPCLLWSLSTLCTVLGSHLTLLGEWHR